MIIALSEHRARSNDRAAAGEVLIRFEPAALTFGDLCDDQRHTAKAGSALLHWGWNWRQRCRRGRRGLTIFRRCVSRRIVVLLGLAGICGFRQCLRADSQWTWPQRMPLPFLWPMAPSPVAVRTIGAARPGERTAGAGGPAGGSDRGCSLATDGAEVIAAPVGPQLEICRAAGADHLIDSRKWDDIARLSKSLGGAALWSMILYGATSSKPPLRA